MKKPRLLTPALAVSGGGLMMLAAIPPAIGEYPTSAASGTFIQRAFTPAAAVAQTTAEGKGKVIAVTPEKQELVLEHGPIKGFMDSMTMGYKVSSPALLQNLKAGDEVHFTIDKKNSVITKISKAKN